MKSLPANSIDCFVCDLPYGCLTGGGISKKETAEKYGLKGTESVGGCAWDIKIDLKEFWEQVKRLAKDDHTPVIMFCTTKFGAELIASNPSWFRYDLVWDKQRGVSFLLSNKMPMRSHEMIYIFSKKGAYYKRVDIKGDFKNWKAQKNIDKKINVYSSGMPNGWVDYGNDGSKRCVKSVIEIANKIGRSNHPTQKPIELYKWLLERYCPEGGTVLDPTAGSFNSCFAAKALGLRAIGIEMDSNFFWKAVASTNNIL